MDNIDKEVYLIMELRYLETFERKGSISDNMDLYPTSWFEIQSYRKKTDILTEAITKKIPIEQTEGFQNCQEGVRISK